MFSSLSSSLGLSHINIKGKRFAAALPVSASSRSVVYPYTYLGMIRSNPTAFVSPALYSSPPLTESTSPSTSPLLNRVFRSSSRTLCRPLPPLLQRLHSIRAEVEHPEIPSSPVPEFQLTPANDEVDWIIVDVLLQETEDDRLPLYVTGETFIENVQDDAKSLVRVLLRDAPVEMSVVLCTDKYIQDLNKQWRDKDAATDVLSFPQNDPDSVLLGDVVISVETASEQAKKRAIDLKDEIRILLVHGTLHLLGYDHEGRKEGDWLVVSFSQLFIVSDTFTPSSH